MSTPRKLRVLVVDDSLTVRMDLRNALSNAGFLVSACSTKALAMTALQSCAFDLAVLDVNLPDGSGIEILKEVKNNSLLRDLRVIMLTNEADVRARMHGLSLGADLYVGKPYERVYIAKMARELCETRSALNQTRWRPFSGKKMLIVGKNQTFWQELSQELRQDGNDVVVTASGTEALELLAVETIACMVLESDVSGMSGLETCRRLRQLETAKETTVLMVNGPEEVVLLEEALAAGADGLISDIGSAEVIRVRLRGLMMKKRGEPARPLRTYPA